MSLDTRLGTRIGDYEVQELIGRGSMSVVYLAEHVRLKRNVALKLLSPKLGEADTSPGRFVIEWERFGHLDHPNIIPIFEAGEVGGLPYIAMKHVLGQSLGEAIEREGALDPTRALDILRQVAAALDFAHERGIVHGNVKPSNILIASDADPSGADWAYVCDFSIIGDSVGSRTLVSRAQTTGTLDYMAPEQIRGDPVDERTDVYALGCVLFETLTGSPPFDSEGADALMSAHSQEVPPRASQRRPQLPTSIDAVLEKALAGRQEGRFRTATDLMTSAAVSLTERVLVLPDAGAYVVPDAPASRPSSNGLPPPTPPTMPSAFAMPGSAGDTTPTAPAPPDRTVPVLTLPEASVYQQPAPVGPVLDPAPVWTRARRRRLLLVVALIAGLALVAGVAIARSGGRAEDVGAGPPRATDTVDTRPALTEPAETATGVVEPPSESVVAPRRVEIAIVGGELVRIEWKASNAGSAPVRFLVFRDQERVADVTRPFFRDTDVAPGERHEYQIVAVGENGSKARSTPVVANLPPAPEPVGQATTSGGEAPAPPPPDQCEGLVVGDDCI